MLGVKNSEIFIIKIQDAASILHFVADLALLDVI